MTQPKRPANLPKYEVKIELSAQKELRKLEKEVRIALLKKIAALEDNPRPHGVEKMEEEDNLYRVRMGRFRIVYEIWDAVLLVLVVKVGPRKDIYKKR